MRSLTSNIPISIAPCLMAIPVVLEYASYWLATHPHSDRPRHEGWR